MDYKYITEDNQLNSLLRELPNSKCIGADIESTGLDPHTSKIRLLQLKLDSGPAWVSDFFKFNPGRLIEALKNYSGIWIIQNAKFETKFLLHHYGLELRRVFDTWRASNIIYNGLEGYKHDLYSIYKRELNLRPPTSDRSRSDWSLPSLDDEQIAYAASDVVYLHAIRDALKKKIVDLGLGHIAKLEFEAVLPEAAMELKGMPIDQDKWRALAKTNQQTRTKLKQDLISVLPNPRYTGQIDLFTKDVKSEWNLDSNAQLLDSLSRMGVHLEDTSKLSLAMCDHPIAKEITTYRKVNQRCKTFGMEWLDNVSSLTHRIHPSFYPYTGAGRYSCSSPNLQQIPRDKEFRSCFTPGSSRVLCVADYSAIELRMVAQLSKDKRLIEAFRNGQDPHTLTAQMITGRQDITKQERQEAKAVNFGFCFSLGPEKFTKYARMNYGITISMDKATDFRDKYFQAYPGIKAWHKRAHGAGSPSRTLLGRLRHLPSDSYGEFFNTPAQGSAADGTKQALRIIYDSLRGLDAHIVATIHDEIILDAHESVAEQALKILKDGMLKGMENILVDVPGAVEGGIAHSWAEK